MPMPKALSPARARRILEGEEAAPMQPMPRPLADAVDQIVDFEIKPSTDEAKLNKTEKAWLEELRRRGVVNIGIQDVTFKLGADLRYTPDFNALINGRWVYWEVKGFMRDDARVKLLAAARKYRHLDFVLVTREKGHWIETEVRP
jgi:hypothetical protein